MLTVSSSCPLSARLVDPPSACHWSVTKAGRQPSKKCSPTVQEAPPHAPLPNAPGSAEPRPLRQHHARCGNGRGSSTVLSMLAGHTAQEALQVLSSVTARRPKWQHHLGIGTALQAPWWTAPSATPLSLVRQTGGNWLWLSVAGQQRPCRLEPRPSVTN